MISFWEFLCKKVTGYTYVSVKNGWNNGMSCNDLTLNIRIYQ